MGNFAGLADAELWALAAEQQDGAAFGEIFERHSAAVYAHCFRRTGHWAMAEDVTSVVFLEAWRRRREVRFAAGSVLPWLLAVANNAASNSQRALRRHQRLLARLPPPSPEPDPADDAARRVDQERAIGPLLAALASLRRAERDVLTLCDWSGLTYAEAATALSIPIGTVRSRLARARRQLRQAAGADAGTAAGCPDTAAARSPMTAIWERT